MRTGEEGTAYLLPRARVPRHAWRAQVGRLRDRRARDDPQLSIHSPRSHAVGPRHAWQCHLVKRARANGRGPCRLNAGPTWGARSAAARGNMGGGWVTDEASREGNAEQATRPRLPVLSRQGERS